MGDCRGHHLGSPTTITDILNKIAIEVVNDQSQSMFLRRFADAWLLTDAENKRILRPAWLVLIEKYRLKEVQGDE